MSRLPLFITLGVGFALGLSSCQANTNNQDPTLIPPRPSGYSGAATQVADFQNETRMLATQIAATPQPNATVQAKAENSMIAVPTYQAYIENYQKTIADAEAIQLQKLEDLGFTEAGYLVAEIVKGVRFYFQPNSKFTLDQMLVELKKKRGIHPTLFKKQWKLCTNSN